VLWNAETDKQTKNSAKNTKKTPPHPPAQKFSAVFVANRSLSLKTKIILKSASLF